MADIGRWNGLIAESDRIADDVLWPRAQEVDQASSIPVEHLRTLADAGLHGLAAPAELGGLGAPPVVQRAVMRRLARGCGATAFCFAQHHGVVTAVAGSTNVGLRRRHLPGLVTGRLAAIAYAHVRRPPPGPLTARRRPGGWQLDGVAPWVTSWGLADLLLLAATTADGRVVWAIVPAESGPHVDASPPLSLSVFGATGTVRIRIDGLEVGDDDVVALDRLDRWRPRDRLFATRPNPLCVGVGDRAISELSRLHGHDDGDPSPDPRPSVPGGGSVASMVEGARGWWRRAVERAEEACGLVDQGVGDPAEVAAVRAVVLTSVQRLTAALMAAEGGRGAQLSSPAQRLAREAQFYIVQAQNADGRVATLDALLREATG